MIKDGDSMIFLVVCSVTALHIACNLETGRELDKTKIPLRVCAKSLISEDRHNFALIFMMYIKSVVMAQLVEALCYKWGRSGHRIPMGSLLFFFHLILPAEPCPYGRHSP